MCCKNEAFVWSLSLFTIISIYTDVEAKSSDWPFNIKVKFKTKLEPNEFIVNFGRYYWPDARHKFIRAALIKANMSEWKAESRHNAASKYPSNFDLLKVWSNCSEDIWLPILQSHPAVKSITPNRSVQRLLSYIPYDNKTNNEETVQIAAYINRRLLVTVPHQLTSTLGAHVLWKQGITGKGVKVAVFDTGLSQNHPHFRRVKERTNWTNEKSLDDGVSHGTFVAGVIASSKECLGLAPDADIHIYRVFTNTQVSYTSWFLDAFNYAIFKKINIINLSIGGPDFLDLPFVEKVLELSANKVIMVSAIGNDGPLYGTLNNPGDQSDVIGVGGITFDEKVAKFSSRGMTTWELPLGYGRLKPDLVTFGSQVKGSNVRAGCRSLSGTSVASPVVAGAITLITSGALDKLELINPSSLKQVLLEGASRLPDINMFEQGYGKLNILKSMNLLSAYEPKVTLSPAYLDFTETYMWPYSSQPMYCGCMPVIVNVTILNGIAVTGKIVDTPVWNSYADENGNLLNVAISFSAILWPWSGWLAIHLVVNEKGCDFEGIARGHISLKVENPTSLNDQESKTTTVQFPMSIKIIPKPPRHKRILWDQFHNLRYPPGYIPRDDLKIKSDPLDWRADHIHTNFRDMYNHLRNSGYYIEVLRMPFTCFNASDYGTLLVVDPEDEFFEEEIIKVQNDVYDSGISLIVFADWYNTTVMKKIKFFDENTRQWWIPDTGGTNIPALNDLLNPFRIAMDDFVAEGYYSLGDHSMYFASGSILSKFPKSTDSIIIGAELNDQGQQILESSTNSKKTTKRFVPILGLLQTKSEFRKKYLLGDLPIATSIYDDNYTDFSDYIRANVNEKNPILNKRNLLKLGKENSVNAYGVNALNSISLNKTKTHSKNNRNSEGRIAVFGDSNCLDSTHLDKACFWLLDVLLQFTMNSHTSGWLKNFNKAANFNFQEKHVLPSRLASSNLHAYSKVLDSNNKFRRVQLPECETLHWVKANILSTADVKLTRDNDAHITVSPDIELNPKLSNVIYKDSQSDADFYSYEDNSLQMVFLCVVLMTFLLLILMIAWLKKRRKLKFANFLKV